MTADIDREKLRELCERATQGPWVPLKGWPDRIVPATHVARSPGASVSEDEDRDNYALVICRAEHNDYSGFAHEIQESEAIANASFITAARTALPALLDLTDAQAAKISELEVENARLHGLINTPHTDDWLVAVPLEAAHQIERWSADHDAGKTPLDWFWLIGYLAQKVVHAADKGDIEKAKHHTISTGAALLNWWQQIRGYPNQMRPGIKPPEGEIK